MGLHEEIAAKRAEIKTDEYSMSIGELINLYLQNELDIHPEFQRYFRWSAKQKTLLIESILLGIPIPPIFVAQQPNGTWDVVDGLQRISTLLQFVGVLRDEYGHIVEPLALEKTKSLPSLEGLSWEDTENDAKSLPQDLQLKIRRSRLTFSIILYDSDPRSKFELFQRLNTSGSPLTDQEVRNSILVSSNKTMYEWMRNLAQDANFQITTSITNRARQEQFDMELILRYLVFRTIPRAELTSTKIGDLSEFLTERMLLMANNDKYVFAREEQAFRSTFELIASAAGEDAFRKYDHSKEKFTGPFLVTSFEVIALGIGFNSEHWKSSDTAIVFDRIK